MVMMIVMMMMMMINCDVVNYDKDMNNDYRDKDNAGDEPGSTASVDPEFENSGKPAEKFC